LFLVPAFANTQHRNTLGHVAIVPFVNTHPAVSIYPPQFAASRAFGFNPSSAHLRATSSTLLARHRNSAASSIERPASIATLRSSLQLRND
jgi:hypothetical protein